MHTRNWVALLFLLGSGCAAVARYQAPPGSQELARANARVMGLQVAGNASFIDYESPEERAVQITVLVQGNTNQLIPGVHAVSLHSVGNCQAIGPDTRLLDLPLLQVDGQGVGILRVATTSIRLDQLLDDDGSSIVIYQGLNRRRPPLACGRISAD